ncbi:hypothetical protein MTO96_036011 [Rhipicephalus appendiculatus]
MRQTPLLTPDLLANPGGMDPAYTYVDADYGQSPYWEEWSWNDQRLPNFAGTPTTYPYGLQLRDDSPRYQSDSMQEPAAPWSRAVVHQLRGAAVIALLAPTGRHETATIDFPPAETIRSSGPQGVARDTECPSEWRERWQCTHDTYESRRTIRSSGPQSVAPGTECRSEWRKRCQCSGVAWDGPRT